nr:hypothetical protein [Tanacetum cinerariifolium]
MGPKLLMLTSLAFDAIDWDVEIEDTFPMVCNFDIGSCSKLRESHENFLKSQTVMAYSSSSLSEVEHSSSLDYFLAFKARDFLSLSFDYFRIVLDHLVNFEIPDGFIKDPEEELHTDTPAETPTVKDKGKGILIEAPKPMKNKDQVEMDAEHAKKLQEELDKEHEESYKNIDWDAALDHVQSKEPQYIKRYHEIKKKPQSEYEARKNMISYLKNIEGYKMEFFKGKTYDQILPIFQARFDANMKFLFKTREEMEKEDEEIIKSINGTPAQKAAKRRKLSEEAQEADDLKKRLEIVQDEDDDVFVEATPLAQKVPVVDYQVVVIDNKPKYKIIRADDTHQFYISFTTLLKKMWRLYGE